LIANAGDPATSVSDSVAGPLALTSKLLTPVVRPLTLVAKPLILVICA